VQVQPALHALRRLSGGRSLTVCCASRPPEGRERLTGATTPAEPGPSRTGVTSKVPAYLKVIGKVTSAAAGA
jgi:hypothetical protein